MLALFMSGSFSLQDNLRVEGGWDREESCPTVSTGGTMHACCGAVPMRKSYNVETQECCVDSNDSTEYVALLGTC